MMEAKNCETGWHLFMYNGIPMMDFEKGEVWNSRQCTECGLTESWVVDTMPPIEGWSDVRRSDTNNGDVT
jgi:hypothetical protein